MKTLGVTMDYIYLRKSGMSISQIARLTGSDRRTVMKYLAHPELINQPRKKGIRKSKLDPYRELIEVLLSKDPSFQASRIYEILCQHGYTGSYDLVKLAVRPLKQEITRKAYVRFETTPGDQAQVDFGEFLVLQPDGTTIKYYVFLMVLGFSRKKHVEILERCNMLSFLQAHIRAFEALGGVPKEIIYDRMANVHIRKLAGKGQFTQALVDLAVHYGFRPVVAPAYSPWVKGKVERPFDHIREGFWRGYSFSSLEQAQEDMTAWLAKKETEIHSTTNERIDERFAKEKQFLSDLPSHRCDISERLYRTVAKDCTIRVDGNTYVVSHKLVNTKVIIRRGDGILRVFHNDELVVSYPVPEGRGNFIQDPRFYEALRADREMNARKYTNYRPKKKGCATISPTKSKYPIEVEHRSIDEYAQYCEGVSNA